MKILEHLEEGLIRQRVEIDEMQCGFMLGCGTTDTIFIVRQLQEKNLIANKPLYMAFVYLEKKTSRFYLVGNAHAWNRRVVSAPGPVHVQGCKKPGKSR